MNEYVKNTENEANWVPIDIKYSLNKKLYAIRKFEGLKDYIIGTFIIDTILIDKNYNRIRYAGLFNPIDNAYQKLKSRINIIESDIFDDIKLAEDRIVGNKHE